jgi:uncharacterized membrane protein
MTLKVCEVVSATLLAFVGGMYWGPWLALTRSMATFDADEFLAVLGRLIRNMAPAMTLLLPLSLLSTMPVLVLSFGGHRETFVLSLAALLLFVLTLVVTMVVEVPIVKTLDVESVPALPDNWEALRDRWGAFHLLRIVPATAGLVLLLVGAIF